MQYSVWNVWCQDLLHVLNDVVISDNTGHVLAGMEGFYSWAKMGIDLRDEGHCLYLIGNGASASMASHFSADLNKNACMRACNFADIALLTAVGNDISFERVFAEPLERMAKEGDVLMTISSSGQSPNILAAIEVARKKKLKVCTLSGMKPDNASRRLGDLNIYVPAKTYGLAETAHAALLHYWTDCLVQSLSAKENE